MKASDAIAEVLAAYNVTYGFELIGGMITHVVDSINVIGKTKLISMHHEQGAAFAAGAISRATQNQQLGVALGTSGPGATNLVTGIADCWCDNHPCLFITGQVNTYEQKGEKDIRQQGFQELDIVSITSSITKYSYQIQTAEEIVPELIKALEISRQGRPGPVLLDIPMDLQRVELPDSVLDGIVKENSETEKDEPPEFQKILECLADSARPLFVLGGGAVRSAKIKEFAALLDILNIPYVSSLKGGEFLPHGPANFGMIGGYGSRVANFAVQHCDLMVVLGSRLDVRQTGANTTEFAPQAKKIQIDIAEGQLDNRVLCDLSVLARCESFQGYFIKHQKSFEPLTTQRWCDLLVRKKEKLITDEYADYNISPFLLFSELSKRFKDQKCHFVADVGNNQMWMAHSLLLGSKQSCHYSGGLGSMGFSIPTAIGIQYATSDPVISINGDGGAQLNIQELDVIARENLPILVIIFNNFSLGMVRNFQELYFDGRNQSTYWGGHTSKFKAIGEGYGVECTVVTSMDDFSGAIKTFQEKPRPLLIEVVMPEARECRPRLEFGNTLDNQSPKIDIKTA